MSVNYSENARDIKITKITAENSNKYFICSKRTAKQLHSATLEAELIPECMVLGDNSIFAIYHL